MTSFKPKFTIYFLAFMQKYQHLFFDLDHTLWDFERNAAESIKLLYDHFELKRHGIESDTQFYETFSVINKNLWQQLDNKQITHQDLRTRRFRESLLPLGFVVDEPTSLAMNQFFLEALPIGKHLIEGTLTTLNYLAEKYELHLVTNGYFEMQTLKMRSSGIEHFFKTLTTNDNAGVLKPDRGIFQYALDNSLAKLENSLMIGDNFESDVLGALNFGMDVVFYNPEGIETHEKPTFNIQKITELTTIL